MKRSNMHAAMMLIIFLLMSTASFSQTATPIVTFENPSSVAAPNGYSHAAVIDLGNCHMVMLSGQVPLDNKGNLVGPGDLEKQTEQVFRNIKNILTELGGTIDHIVRLGYYVTDASQIQTVRNVRDRFINVKMPPASTLVEVSQLFRKDVLIEVEATAIIPNSK